MKPIAHSTFRTPRSDKGAALVIILAFVVLLAGLVVAFFSRAISERQLSDSSANQTRVSIFADGAVDQIIGDLKQEIAASGTATTITTGTLTTTLYQSGGASTYVPYTNVTTGATIPNLLKTSGTAPFFSGAAYSNLVNYPPSNRGTILSSTASSSNGRYISAERWNKPLLMPIASGNNYAPPASANFVPPNWVLVTRSGTNPNQTSLTSPLDLRWSGTNADAVVGRYAYAIYDEGGLLDMNVAGYPLNGNPPYVSGINSDLRGAYKSVLAFADLTQIPEVASLPSSEQMKLINGLVGWRNFASSGASGSLSSGYTIASTGSNTAYGNFISANDTGFLRVSGTALNNNQSDRMFTSRQELIRFIQSGLNVTGTNIQLLNSLTTFSRDLSQPSFAPDPNRPKVLPAGQGGTNAAGLDDQINPSYLTVRVQQSFTRNDGSTANVGDPLVNKRFALNRLAWLTCKGPSARRSQNDPDIQALINNGIPWSYLQLGTDTNIQKYFGLNWNGSQWLYNIHNNSAGGGRGSIMRVGRPPSDPANSAIYVEDLASGRDPDFFELLKSAITVGSLGKSLVNGPTAVIADSGASPSEQPYNYNYDPERSVDRQIIQIGANMINQSRPDNFPVQIVFDDGVGNRNASATAATATTVVGVANLPYLYYIFNGVLEVAPPSVLPRAGKGNTPKYNQPPGTGVAGDSGYQAGDTAALIDPGVGAIMQIPALWNPHDPAGPAAVDGPKEFRVVADSTTPDQIGTSNYNKFFAYSASVGTTAPGGMTNSYVGVGPKSSWYQSVSLTGKEIAHTITASNNEIDFTANSGAVQLFPEPTMLLRDATINDSNGNAVTVKLGGTPLMSTDPAVNTQFSGKGLPNWIPNATQSPSSPYPTTTSYLGFYLGAFPWAWNYPGGTVPLSGAQSSPAISRVTGNSGGSVNSCYLTYRVQCKDAFGNWITYDTKYGKVSDGGISVGNIGTINPTGALLPSAAGDGFWATVTDPRTSRFGIHWNGLKSVNGVNNEVSTGANGGLMAAVTEPGQGGWLDYANGILKTNRPDAQSGFYFMACWRNAGMPSATSGWMAWSGCNAVAYPGLAPGLLSQNNPDIHYSPSRTYGDGQGGNTEPPNYFADPDGMVRRGMGAFVPIGLPNSPTTPSGDSRVASADTTVGLPTARIFAVNAPQPNTLCPTITNYTPGSTLSQAQSRPYFLHRPFRSVAELGCVFSDTPWRNLDFFTSESGNTALLDVFCINDTEDSTGLVAGKVNLNTRHQPILKAVLGGAYLDPANISTGAATSTMDAATADDVASALMTYIDNNGPLQNLAELVGKWKSNAAISHPAVNGVTKPPLTAPFYDGKLSYIGFSGGQWDSAIHKPKVTSPAADVYSAYMGAAAFGDAGSQSANHNGPRETAAYIQRIREAPIRALTACGQTRVWNLMIDVVAQTGRYPQSANSLDKFQVEGEQRYWVHVAIDRLTGQVIDKQIEVVKE